MKECVCVFLVSNCKGVFKHIYYEEIKYIQFKKVEIVKLKRIYLDYPVYVSRFSSLKASSF